MPKLHVVYVVFCVVILLGVQSNHQVYSDEIYMCGTVVIDSTRDIKPLLDGTKIETSLGVGRCRWRLKLSSNISEPSFDSAHSPNLLLHVYNTDDDPVNGDEYNMYEFNFCASTVKTSRSNCEVVYRGDVVKLVDVQVHLSDEDKTHRRDEDWYISRVIPYATNVHFRLVHVDRLEDVFGPEWRSLGVGRGVTWMKNLRLALYGSVPRLDGVMGGSGGRLEHVGISVRGKELYGNQTLGKVVFNSMVLNSFTVDAKQAKVEDVVLKTRKLEFLWLSFKNLGQLLVEKRNAYLLSSGNDHSAVANFEQVFVYSELLNTLQLFFSSFTDRMWTLQLPKSFFVINFKNNGVFVIKFASKLPSEDVQLLPPWQAGIPNGIEALVMDWTIFTDAFLKDILRIISTASPSSPSPSSTALALEFSRAAWNSTTFRFDVGSKLSVVEFFIDLLPLHMVPPDIQEKVVDVDTRGSQDPQYTCQFQVSCSLCSQEHFTNVVFLPEECIKRGTYFLARNVRLGVSSASSLASIDFSNVKTISFNKATFTFPVESLKFDISNVESLSLSNMNQSFPWERFFPCAFVPKAEAPLCCKNRKRTILNDLLLSNLGSFPIRNVTFSTVCLMPELLSLNIDDIPITSIETNLSANLPKLSSLSITGGNLTRLPKGLVRNNSYAILTFSRNLISFIEEGFCVNSVLLSLDASFNRLKQFDLSSLKENECEVSTLVLNNNHITSFSASRGYETVFLDVDLSHNRIEKLPKSMFMDIPTLQVVNLKFNSISSSSISKGFMRNCCSTKGCIVDLSHNQIRNGTIPISSFFVNTTVMALNLSYNEMTTFPYDFTNITSAGRSSSGGVVTSVLNLKGNFISSIDHSICLTNPPQAKWRVFYDLSNCLIRTVSPKLLSCDKSISVQSQLGVNLENNPLSCFPVPSEAGLTNLMLLNLANTNVTNIPCGLTSAFPFLKAVTVGPYLSSDTALDAASLPTCCALANMAMKSHLILGLKLEMGYNTDFMELTPNLFEETFSDISWNKAYLMNAQCSVRGKHGDQTVHFLRDIIAGKDNYCSKKRDRCLQECTIDPLIDEDVFTIVYSVLAFVGLYVLLLAILTCTSSSLWHRQHHRTKGSILSLRNLLTHSPSSVHNDDSGVKNGTQDTQRPPSAFSGEYIDRPDTSYVGDYVSEYTVAYQYVDYQYVYKIEGGFVPVRRASA